MRAVSVAGLAGAGALFFGVATASPPAGALKEAAIGPTVTGAVGTDSHGRSARSCGTAGRSVPPPGPREAVRETTNARRGEVNGTQSAGGRRVVRILAERFSFTPSEIRVPRGVTLELRVRSDDTMHGFRIAARSVNLMVPKRRQGEAVVVFEATEPGRYEFECSRLCGAGHNFMRGAIVVEEAPAAGRGARP